MRTQDCRQLTIKKVKKRPTGFAAETEEASSSGVPGEATGGLFLWASTVQPSNRRTREAEPGSTGSASSTVQTSNRCTGTPPLGRTSGGVFPIFLRTLANQIENS
eukprot:921319-Amphidinium_carterae.1